MVARFLPASQRGLPKQLLIALAAEQVTQPSAFHEGLVTWLHKSGHMWCDVSTLDTVSCRMFYLGLLAYCLGLDLELDPLYWRIPKKLSCCQACKCSLWKICANHCLEFFISIHPVRGLHKRPVRIAHKLCGMAAHVARLHILTTVLNSNAVSILFFLFLLLLLVLLIGGPRQLIKKNDLHSPFLQSNPRSGRTGT
uniref:Uncharacterized protein n=1 Tax=Ixodes ricinus TaxID=34613 RepID=A0A6B0V1X3_IXORI